MRALLTFQVGRGAKLGCPPSALRQKREGGMKEGASTLVERRSLLPAPLLASPGGAFQASPHRTPPRPFLVFRVSPGVRT